MFGLNYFWFFMAAFFFSSALSRYAKSDMIGTNPLFKNISMLLGPICDLLLIVFLIVGFWKMPHWWHPIVFLLIGGLLQGIQGLLGRYAEFVVIIIGMLLAPICTILAYLGLFGLL